LAEALAASGNKFDRTGKDFDVLDRLVRVVLRNKPESAVAVLADGDFEATAFLPNDFAFTKLTRNLVGGKAARTERRAAKALVENVDVDTLETVLLYHVVPGAPLDSGDVAGADGAELETAQGGIVTVDVNGKNGSITLVDQDPDNKDPRVVAVDINKGSKQVGHAVNRVLRPVDL
ncbi:fasciclin domain-containing protein, partial [Nocardioides salarius]|uniref:fasciclin domain-containing protein n=1 Tax=Nocardioides salarius TaxID=374513 RepID=UPI0030F7EB8C